MFCRKFPEEIGSILDTLMMEHVIKEGFFSQHPLTYIVYTEKTGRANRIRLKNLLRAEKRLRVGGVEPPTTRSVLSL